MGNRAVITAAPFNKNNIGVYVHWNGGQESVEGFLAACRQLGYRDPTSDTSYGMARLAQAIGLFFGAEDDCSVGVDICDRLDCDNGDNGVWLIGPDWTLAGRTNSVGDGPEAIVPLIDAEDIAKRDAITAGILQLTANAQRKWLKAKEL